MNAPTPSPSATLRATTDGPFCWQNKSARRRIREAFDATNNVASALAVYDALCEIASDASDKGREVQTFTTTHAWIQRMSGVSVSTIKKHLAVLSETGLVHVSTPGLRAPSIYTLLANGCPTSANGCLALANGCLALANGGQSGALATSEESQEEFEKIGEDQSGRCAPPVFVPHARTWKQWLELFKFEDAWSAYVARWKLSDETQNARADLFCRALNNGNLLWLMKQNLDRTDDGGLAAVADCSEFMRDVEANSSHPASSLNRV